MPLDYMKFTLVKSNLAYSSRANSVSSITTCFKQISTQSTKSLIIKLTVLNWIFVQILWNVNKVGFSLSISHLQRKFPLIHWYVSNKSRPYYHIFFLNKIHVYAKIKPKAMSSIKLVGSSAKHRLFRVLENFPGNFYFTVI